MNSLIAFFASIFTPDNIEELVGITFMVLWAWSEKLSFNPNEPANGVLQKIAPIVKALGERMAPPVVTQAIECMDKPKVTVQVDGKDVGTVFDSENKPVI